MDLFLVQHGEAFSEAQDPSRPLSETGRRSVEFLARAMKRLGLVPAQVICTGKRRSAQTAEIICRELGIPAERIVSSDAFVPGAEPERMCSELERLYGADPVLVAGHLPSLGKLAGHLLAGESRQVCRFRNAGLCHLRTEGLPRAGAGMVVCLLQPEHLRMLAVGGVTAVD